MRLVDHLARRAFFDDAAAVEHDDAVGAAAAGIAANLAGLGEGATGETARAAAFWVFAAFLPLLAIGGLAALRFTARNAA